ncbi:SDR family NAD(P)-dependent oxidoreductase [Gordonia sp. CPCC 205333]|uniref:SDR family NAD(P)-dependent oxidoreductase n=1 Tax=Gordonia sp. CPCC 205333 TaxID=3140790 RepID=UPI003AF4003F
MPSIAIFGAGPATGLSAAHRFGAEGFELHLYARNPQRLEELGRDLTGTGYRTHTTRLDLTDIEGVRAAADDLLSKYGVPDVVLYSPGDTSRLPTGVLTLDAATVTSWSALNLLSPVELGNAFVPAMRQRGSGTFVVTQGPAATAVHPDLASTAIAQAATLHYLRSLHSAVRANGVHIAALQISGLIDRSDAARLFGGGTFDGIEFGELHYSDPDRIAQEIWDLSHRDVREDALVVI